MASKKEFEVLFALNAQMNGGFSGTFSKAQAEFTRLGKEIQGLHRVQGDIASYQKQQSAIESTRSKLESLQKQHGLLQREIEETEGSTAGLEREKVKLEERIKNTEAALERQNQKLGTTGERLKAAGVDTGNLAQKDAELTAKIKELETAQDDAANGAASFGEKASQGVTAVGDALAAAGIAVALKEIADAYMECVGLAGDFEEAMSNVEALSQANAREMAALSAQAKELGATTKFTAQEAGDAMGYMAMAGWDAADMLQGMDGVLQLAAASGEDLAMVSDIVTDSLSAFGLTAKDTAHFSDVLAAAATSSNTNVAIMGETFKMSASVAGALGYSIEDVAVAMGLMANSGVKGSIAGTALRNTFDGLLEGVTLTGAAFGEYEYCAVRADGTMKDFGATINELRGCFEQMTEAERVANAQAIAGQRGYNGLLAILNATDADYASLTNSINNCTGAAQRMANVKLDNLNGQLTLMDSAWDALRVTIGEEFTPELRGLAELGTDVLGWINGFVQENPALVKGLMAAAGAIGAGGAALVGVVTVTKVLIPLMSALTAATPGVNIIMGVTAAVAGVAGVVTALATAAGEGVPSVKELTEAAREMREVMDDASAACDETVAATLAAANVADTYISKLAGLDAAAGGSAESSREYQNTLALLLQVMPELSDCVSQTTDEYGRTTYALETSTDALLKHVEAVKESAMAQAYTDKLSAAYAAYADVLLEAEGNSIKLTEAEYGLEDAQKRRAGILEKMRALEAADPNYHGGYFDTDIDAIDNMSEEYRELQGQLAACDNEIGRYNRTIGNLHAAMEDDAKATAEAEAGIAEMEAAIYDLTGSTGEQTAAQARAAAQLQELEAVIGDTAEQVLELSAAYDEAYIAALDSVSGQYALWDKAAKVAATSVGDINQAMESQISYWQDYNANLQTLTDHAGDIEGLRDVIASFADGSQESVNAVAGMVDALNRGDTDSVKKMVDNWKELQKEQKTAADSIAELKTDFTAAMDEMQAELASDIEDMDLGYEAALSGQATIQGYIDGAAGMLPAVRRQYAELGQAALDSLSGSLYVPANAAGAYLPPSVRAAMMTNRGYASGTDNAQRGWAYVGEDGPELMFFNGGEKVLNAAQTSALHANAAPVLSAGGSSPSVQVTFQIGGNATPEVVQDLRGFADEIVGRVMDTLEDAKEDARRRAY